MANKENGMALTQNHAKKDNKQITSSALHLIRQTKKEQACMRLLSAGRAGVTEIELLDDCRVISGRNYPTELERKLGIKLGRDGIGTHLLYWITCHEDAVKVAEHINTKRKRRHADFLSGSELEALLTRDPQGGCLPNKTEIRQFLISLPLIFQNRSPVNSVEQMISLVLETYGRKEGEPNAAIMLTAMISSGSLSELGITVMNELFSSPAEMVQDMIIDDTLTNTLMNQSIH